MQKEFRGITSDNKRSLEPIDSISAIVTTSARLESSHLTTELLDRISSEIGGFDEEIHYGGRLKEKVKGELVTITVTLNSTNASSGHSRVSNAAEDTSNRVRINVETKVGPDQLSQGISASLFAAESLNDEISFIKNPWIYSFLLKIHTASEKEIDLGMDGLTERGTTEGGHRYECFDNKIKIKQVSEGEIDTALRDFSTIVTENIKNKI